MEIYVLILIILLINIKLEKYLSKSSIETILYCVTSAILVFVSGFRSYVVGIDTLQYVDMFYHASWYRRNFEAGFSNLLDILYSFYNHYSILILISSIIILLPIIYYIYNNSPRKIYSLFLFFTLNGFAMCMNAMRQYIALSIIIIFYILYRKNKKLLLYCIGVLIAMLFHYTAIIALVLPFLRKYELSLKKYIIITLLSIISLYIAYDIFFFIANNLESIGYNEYVNGSNFSEKNSFGAVIKSLLAGVNFIIIYLGCKDEREGDFYINAALMALILNIYATQAVVIERVVIYFDWTLYIGVPIAFYNMRSGCSNLIEFIYTIIVIIHWFVIAIYRPEWHGVIPYDTYLF